MYSAHFKSIDLDLMLLTEYNVDSKTPNARFYYFYQSTDELRISLMDGFSCSDGTAFYSNEKC